MTIALAALKFIALFTILILSARYLIQRKGSKAIDRDWRDGVPVVDVPDVDRSDCW